MILRLRYLTLLLDAIVLVGSFCLAYGFRVGWVFSTDFPFQPYFLSSLLAAAGWIAALLIFRGYNPAVRFTRPIHLIKVLVAGLTGTALFGLIYYFANQEIFSRLLLVYIFGIGSAAMIIVHLAMQAVEKRLLKKGLGTIKLLVIGSNRGAKSFIKELQKNVSPYVAVAVLDGYGTKQKELSGVPVLGKLNILEETIDSHGIQGIVQADNIEQVVNIVQFCDQRKLEYFLLPYALGAYQQELKVRHLEQPVIASQLRQKNVWEMLLS